MVTVMLSHVVLWTAVAGLAAGLINSTIGFGNLLSFIVLTSVLGVPALGAHLANQIAAPASFATAAAVSRRHHQATASMVVAGTVGTLLGGVALARIPADWVRNAAPSGVLAGAILLALVPLTRRVSVPWQLPGLTVAGLWGGTVGAGVGSFVMPCVDGPAAAPTRNVLCLPMGVAVSVPLVILAADRVNWTLVGALSVGMLVGGYLGSTLLNWLPRKQSTSDRLREIMAAAAVGACVYLATGDLASAAGALAVGCAVLIGLAVWRHAHAAPRIAPSVRRTAL